MQEDTVNNRYEIVKEVGRGAYGSVHEAISKKTGAKVAIKIVPLTETNKKNLVQEILSLRKLSQPNCNPYVVCYYDSFYNAITNSIVIEMEYVHGVDLMTYTQPARSSRDLSLLYRTAKMSLIAMLNGIKYIHSKGLLHNDIKPGNIVVDENKVPILVDLGISCVTQEAVKSICTVPYNKVVGDCCQEMSGTSLYIPPEVLKDVRYPQSDLWSLGATIYELVTGTNIWGLDVFKFTPVNLMAQVIIKFTQGTLPNKLNTGDYQLDTIVNGFLKYDPLTRMSIDQALVLIQQ